LIEKEDKSEGFPYLGHWEKSCSISTGIRSLALVILMPALLMLLWIRRHPDVKNVSMAV
jgi:hypothetical protein